MQILTTSIASRQSPVPKYRRRTGESLQVSDVTRRMVSSRWSQNNNTVSKAQFFLSKSTNMQNNCSHSAFAISTNEIEKASPAKANTSQHQSNLVHAQSDPPHEALHATLSAKRRPHLESDHAVAFTITSQSPFTFKVALAVLARAKFRDLRFAPPAPPPVMAMVLQRMPR